ncbi:MAG: ABC transporter ATP-binding protein [Betaproteobacteria bacterium]|nr:MAG: ABC transporter ATP-binding protein [Betaproteobacteria bacterium]
MTLLRLERVSSGYGTGDILRNVSIEIGTHECVAVLGANGAGKTTLLRTISGLLHRRLGAIEFGGKPLPNTPHRIAALGVAHVPEGRGTIAGLTVEENLLVGAFTQRFRANVDEDLKQCYERFPILREYRHRPATHLSGGEQQMLAISRALMLRPNLLLLDEPSFGLAPKVVRVVYEAIRKIIEEGRLAVLLVEQSAELAMSAATRAYVLKHGEVVGAGSRDELCGSPELSDAYIGMARRDA